MLDVKTLELNYFILFLLVFLFQVLQAVVLLYFFLSLSFLSFLLSDITNRLIIFGLDLK